MNAGLLQALCQPMTTIHTAFIASWNWVMETKLNQQLIGPASNDFCNQQKNIK